MKFSKNLPIFFCAFFVLFVSIPQANALTCISCSGTDQSSWNPTTESECEFFLRGVEGTGYRGIRQFDTTVNDCSTGILEEVTGPTICPITPEITFDGHVELSVPEMSGGSSSLTSSVRIGTLDSEKCPLDTAGIGILLMQDSSGEYQEIGRGDFEVGPEIVPIASRPLDEVLSMLGKNEGDSVRTTVAIRFPGISDYPLWTTDFALTKLNIAANSGFVPPSPAPPPTPYVSTPPRLEIPLPTLPSFSSFMPIDVTGEPGNRYLLIPWIGEYIAALYKYAIGITGVLAGFMIVIAGLIWLTAGGSAEKVGTAKSYIEGALVGLVIALTSYTLLYAINPKLTEFDALKVKFVERVDFVQNELLTTTVDTTGDGGRGGGGGEGGGGDVSGTVTGWQSECADSYPDCPIILNEPCVAGSGVGPNNARGKEFLEKIKGTLGGETARQKVLKIADAATKCGVVLGSCGKTVEQINGVAGISGKGPKRKGLRDNNLLCAINCDSPGKTCQNLLDSHAQCGQAPGAPKRKEAFEKIREGNPGYPDEWTNLLEPGDAFDMYAVNSAVGGQHAVIFIGWEGDGKKARVMEGASGKLVKYGSWCIKSTCPNPTPVTYVYNAGQ